MQIQRIRTVYIFLALVAMMIFVIVPYGEVDYLSGQPVVTEKLYTMYEYGLLIPAAAAVILLIVDIFLFRNLPLQRTVLTISLLLTLCCIAVVCFILFKQAGAEEMDAHFSVRGYSSSCSRHIRDSRSRRNIKRCQTAQFLQPSSLIGAIMLL